jgi:hypothetical protein
MRLTRSSLLAAGLVLILGGTTLAEKVDQSQTTTETSVRGPDRLFAQTFTAGRTGRLVGIRLFPRADLDGAQVTIRTTEGGLPTDTVLASTPWRSHAVGRWVRASFADPTEIVPGTRYAIVIDPAGSWDLASTYISANPYAGGTLLATTDSGDFIEPFGNDLAFQTIWDLGGFVWVGSTGVRTPRAGATTTIRFTLGSDRGLGILRGGSPTVRRVSCTTHRPVAGTEWHTRPFGGDLSYSASTGRYSLSWKVPAAWGSGALACRELRVRLIDGSTHSLFFRFRAPA